jgi:hypothetical protein
MYLITQPVQVLLCSNSAMKGNNGTKRILYHDVAAKTITEPPPCFIVGIKAGIPDCRLPWVFSKRKLFLILTISRSRFQLSDVQVLWS